MSTNPESDWFGYKKTSPEDNGDSFHAKLTVRYKKTKFSVFGETVNYKASRVVGAYLGESDTGSNYTPVFQPESKSLKIGTTISLLF